ncbi:hypothetical protein AC1031_020368 [Aphanomyces cochlioides]|nr:hypothetical protein AC1031_020368 [Aphanomyces cochlioides]
MNSNDLECKYTYKVCTNPRSQKRDGTLHRLCQEHRNQANALQKAYATKRREELRSLRELVILGQTKQPLPAEEANVEALHSTMEDYSLIVESELEPLDSSQQDVPMLTQEEYAHLCKLLEKSG